MNFNNCTILMWITFNIFCLFEAFNEARGKTLAACCQWNHVFL